jgi:hypothetical protein
VTNRRRMAPGGGGEGGTAWAVPPGAPEPLIRVADDIEDEYPAPALATECFANLCRALS